MQSKKFRPRRRDHARAMPRTRHSGTTGGTNGGIGGDQQKTANRTAIACAAIAAGAAIITGVIADFVAPAPVTVTINNAPPQATAPVPHPVRPPGVLGSSSPVLVPVPAPAYASRHKMPPYSASHRPGHAFRRSKHVPPRRPQALQPSGSPVLTITILNTPGPLGSLLAPVQLEWAASVTTADDTVEQGCVIGWTLYSDGASIYLGTTSCNGDITLDNLYLEAGSFVLVGDAVLPTGSKAEASAGLEVEDIPGVADGT